MSEQDSGSDRIHLNPPAFCYIPGCTTPSETTRRVPLASGEELEIEVCWKHAEGELDLDSITPS